MATAGREGPRVTHLVSKPRAIYYVGVCTCVPWGRQWWPAIRTSNGHLGAHLRCTLSSSCHRIALATAPDTPTPQHRFADPQKLAAGFQLAFSRTGPKTVSCSPLLVSRFGGEHNVLSLHTRSPVMSGLHLSTCGRDKLIPSNLLI